MIVKAEKMSGFWRFYFVCFWGKQDEAMRTQI